MKKTKLFTSLAAFVLVLSLGACDENTDETTDKGSETTETEDTSESTETGDTGDEGGSTEIVTLSNYTLSIGIAYDESLVQVPEYATAYIQGSWDNWTDWVSLTESADGRYEYTFSSIELGTYMYQLVLAYSDQQPGWTYRITQDGGDASFTVNENDGDDYKNEVTVTASKALEDIIPDPSSSYNNVKLTIDITYNGVSQDILDYGTLWIEGGWDSWAGFVECTVEDGKYVCTFDSLVPIEYEFLGVIYYTGEDLPSYETLWDYKVNGNDNAKFTVEGAEVNATLVATKPLADILPEKGGDGGEDDFPFEVNTSYFLGYNRSGTIYYYNGQVLNTYYGDVSTDISKAVKVTLGASNDKYTLMLEDGKYLGAAFGEHANFKWDLSDPYEWEYNSTYQTFVAYNTSNTAYCLGTSGAYNEITLFTLSSAASNYPATLYEIPADWTPYEEPEINEGSFTEVKTGKLGLYQENKNSYYYFTGTKDGNFGVMSTSWDQGVDVTLLSDETYYYIRFVYNTETLYFGHTDTSNSQVALNTNPYPLQYNATHEAFLNTDASRFLGTYSNYETLSWSTVSYLGQSGQFIAKIYETQPDLGGGDQGENEGNEDETLVGTLDFSSWCTENANANTAFSTTTLGNCLTASYNGTGTISAVSTEKAYPASNGSGDGLKGSTECIQLGASSSTGNICFSLTGTDNITKVVVKAVCYETSAKNMKVNDNSQSVSYICTSYSTWDSVPTIEYTIDAATTITIASVTASNGRILVHSIELYSA